MRRKLTAPRSLRGRLILSATALLVTAVLVAAGLIGLSLNRFVTGQIDQRLDAQVMALASALQRDGKGDLVLTASFDAPPFDDPRSGWFWQVRQSDGTIVARSSSAARWRDIRFSLMSVDLPPRPPHAPPGPSPRPMRVDGARGGPERGDLHGRGLTMAIGGTEVTVAAAAPERAIFGPLRDALIPVGLVMAALVAGLLVAVFWQVRIGLKPLRRLRDDLAAVRGGRQRYVPADQPAEIAPLAAELNALIDETTANLERARRHVANLAHGLKTPLATLLLTLSEPGRDPDGDASALAGAMDRRIRHHLGRARSAAVGGPGRSARPIEPHVADLVIGLSRIHAERGLAFNVDLPVEASVACEPQDLDEMLGNLLDNACKWAAHQVRVGAARAGGSHWQVTIEDDGEGIAAGEAERVMEPGRRLDEATPGHGFGLTITRELAELYGGDLAIGASTLGGVMATLRLPAAQGV
ncbi:sensor histidine kinase [Jiella sp. MQZ9-1]|uniref:histidine kinase n=1 Tax=Jiella flava TaxID=2816857 RepID=A0A939G0A7_9HYPH|nr:sensor histidine kinase [Jiella flava]MBO0664021.1 sensor histidine kinase [Jiella flava]MCD2472593.1 sensor histidine kinase [Jiella flava]